ncbi:hypothetical protein V8J88_10910 [Massilia sp. W12]|uniref:hypothetical protein n=1 Tax=Massilia sp. W12 TaxID=3126507 RepID=UPI0030D40E10
MDDIFFKAKFTTSYEEDGVLTVAFSDSEKPDPENYIILQRAIPEDPDDYFFEINSRELSGEGGFFSAELNENELKIIFSEKLKEYSEKNGIIINISECKELVHSGISNALDLIFQLSDCKYMHR